MRPVAEVLRSNVLAITVGDTKPTQYVSFGLDFIPVAREHFDFLVRKEFRERLPRRAVGLTPTDETGTVLYRPPDA